MHYHLILTDQCNLQCRYCYQKSLKELEHTFTPVFTFDFSQPSVSRIPPQALKEFLKKDDNPVLIFYGGEPLLEIQKIKKIIDTIDMPFRMQTNGLLLHALPPHYLKKIGKILISLDGDKQRTDRNRGKGTYDAVMKNISLISPWYKGEIVARMTITQDCPDIYEQVISLIRNGFTSVHWQLDAGFYASDFDQKIFATFVTQYNRSISALIDYWVQSLQNNHFFTLYPFVGIVSSLLTGSPTKLRCGAGHAGYCITTSGTIVACPITAFIKEFAAGNVASTPQTLKKFDVSGRCMYCKVRTICGGRCLYWNKAHLWPEKGDHLICHTIKHLIESLKEKVPTIQRLIKAGVLSPRVFEYEKYYGPEIIP